MKMVVSVKALTALALILVLMKKTLLKQQIVLLKMYITPSHRKALKWRNRVRWLLFGLLQKLAMALFNVVKLYLIPELLVLKALWKNPIKKQQNAILLAVHIPVKLNTYSGSR
jgi:hypothetical protein